MPTKKRTSTKFRKLVLSPGKYPKGKNKSGEEQYEEFDENRLKSIADNGNKFLSTGARIPVPFAHYDDNGKLVSPVNIGTKGALRDAFSGQPIGWRSDLNAGFVESFEYGTIEDPDTGQTEEGLISVLEVDGDINDPQTAAGKLGRTIREVSIGIHKDREDKHGNKYSELPIHVAACLNPVNTTQGNFVPCETFSSNVVLFNTSSPMEETGDSESSDEDQDKPKNPIIPDDPQASSGANQMVANVVEGLRRCGIDLPEDTTQENFFERAGIAIRQKLASEIHDKTSEDEEEVTTSDPSGKTPSGAPIAMSANTTNYEKQTALLFSNYLASKRGTLKDRVKKLVSSGRISAKYAEEFLTPKVEALTLSNTSVDELDENGNLPETEIEKLVSGLESASAEDLTQKGATNSEQPSGDKLEPPSDADRQYWGFNEDMESPDAEELRKISASIPA